MGINVGHVFQMGKSHRVCEDYAASGTLDGDKYYAFVSDGCSGSDNTDIGARLLVRQAIKRFDGGVVGVANLDQLIASADSSREMLGLHPTSLDATLLGVGFNGNAQTVGLFAAGDGCIVLKYKSGSIQIVTLNPCSINGGEYPIYLSYRLDKKRLGGLIQTEGFSCPTFNDAMYDSNDKVQYMLDDDCPTYTYRRVRYSCEEINFIAVMSDGLSTFSDENRKGISVLEIVKELMAFKSTGGPFVDRRMNGFRKKCKREGWTHDDDFSMAVISLGEE